MSEYIVCTPEQMHHDLHDAYINKKPFCVVSLGDGELMFLCTPELKSIVRLNQYIQKEGGVIEEAEQVKKDIISLLPEIDYAWSHQPTYTFVVSDLPWVTYHGVFPMLFKLYNIHDIKVIPNHSNKYISIVDGTLFKNIEGAKVVLIGHHAPEVERRSKMGGFKSYFAKTGINQLNIVGSIGCSATESYKDIPLILEKIKQFDCDVVIGATAIPHMYLMPALKKMGYIAITIGHAMSGFAGVGDVRRTGIEHNFDWN